MNIPARVVLCIVFCAVIAGGFLHAAQPEAAAERKSLVQRPAIASGVVAPGAELAALEHDANDVGTYVRALADEEAFWSWTSSVDAFLRSLYVPPPPPAATSYVVGSAPRSAGGHSDAWWHGVAICEQSGRNDAYFGYFSFMDGSMGGQPWDVQVAAGNALLASVGHEVGPWAQACVNAGYAASPGG